MAWIRTSLSLIGFGFGIPTIVRTIEKTQVIHDMNPVRFSVIVGLAFRGRLKRVTGSVMRLCQSS